MEHGYSVVSIGHTNASADGTKLDAVNGLELVCQPTLKWAQSNPRPEHPKLPLVHNWSQENSWSNRLLPIGFPSSGWKWIQGFLKDEKRKNYYFVTTRSLSGMARRGDYTSSHCRRSNAMTPGRQAAPQIQSSIRWPDLLPISVSGVLSWSE